MFARFQHQEGPERTQDQPAATRFTLPDRSKRLLQEPLSEFIEEECIFPIAIQGSADQRDVALASRNARRCDSHRFDAGCLLAHEQSKYCPPAGLRVAPGRVSAAAPP